MRPLIPALLAAAALAGSARADGVQRNYAQPASPVAASVVVPSGYETVYVSGMTAGLIDPSAPAGSVAAYGSTAVQTESALKRLAAVLAAQGLGLGDVVQMRVYLVGDPSKGGQIDFAGMTSAYARRFGTPEQPNRPARTTIQVVSLPAPGLLVEVEAVAARPPHAPAAAQETDGDAGLR